VEHTRPSQWHTRDVEAGRNPFRAIGAVASSSGRKQLRRDDHAAGRFGQSSYGVRPCAHAALRPRARTSGYLPSTTGSAASNRRRSMPSRLAPGTARDPVPPGGRRCRRVSVTRQSPVLRSACRSTEDLAYRRGVTRPAAILSPGPTPCGSSCLPGVGYAAKPTAVCHPPASSTDGWFLRGCCGRQPARSHPSTASNR
jgi:hypothetical protein